MIESLAATLEGGLKTILSLFPDSPFSVLTSMGNNGQFAELLGFLNWFIPIYSFLAILQGWLTCILFYYVWQLVLRWLKMIE